MSRLSQPSQHQINLKREQNAFNDHPSISAAHLADRAKSEQRSSIFNSINPAAKYAPN
jgi:hypothetical protein